MTPIATATTVAEYRCHIRDAHWVPAPINVDKTSALLIDPVLVFMASTTNAPVAPITVIMNSTGSTIDGVPRLVEVPEKATYVAPMHCVCAKVGEQRGEYARFDTGSLTRATATD